MKNYRETYIRRKEIAQLILLHQLYQQKDSRHLIFQGGCKNDRKEMDILSGRFCRPAILSIFRQTFERRKGDDAGSH